MLGIFFFMCKFVFLLYFLTSPIVFFMITVDILKKVGIQRQGWTEEEAAVEAVAEVVVETVKAATAAVIVSVVYLVFMLVLSLGLVIISREKQTNDEGRRHNLEKKNSN